jgi:glutamate racemase
LPSSLQTLTIIVKWGKIHAYNERSFGGDALQIGFFDSGIGGITVLHKALKMIPDEDYLYYADSAHVPYGEKSKEEVKDYVFSAVDFMVQKGIKALVVACNTATSAAIEDLRKKYDFPVIGMEPAVKPAVEFVGNSDKRVLVFATELSLKEEKFQNLIKKVDPRHIVDYIPLPKLVYFAEQGRFDSSEAEEYLKNVLSRVPMESYGAVVLGCTHYPYFYGLFRRLLPEGILLIDGNRGTVKNLKRILEQRGNIPEGSGFVEFYASGRKITEKEELDRYCRLVKRLDDLETEGVKG